MNEFKNRRDSCNFKNFTRRGEVFFGRKSSLVDCVKSLYNKDESFLLSKHLSFHVSPQCFIAWVISSDESLGGSLFSSPIHCIYGTLIHRERERNKETERKRETKKWKEREKEKWRDKNGKIS